MNRSQLQETLQKAGLERPQDLISVAGEFLNNLGICDNDIELLRSEAAKIICQESIRECTLLEINEDKWSHFSFGCESLDNITGGGILCRGITEICGESGAGKTQILLQLSLMVQLPKSLKGFHKGAIYICTEGPFPSRRLTQLINFFEEKYHANIKYSENIYVQHILDVENLLRCTTITLDGIVEKYNIGLIIIDSIAAIFRTEDDIIKRANDMRKMASALLHIANKHNTAIVCTNQVTSVINENKLVPCLGLAWANLIRTRLQVHKITTNIPLNSNSINKVGRSNRKMDVVFSPDVPNKFSYFDITSNGIENTI